MTALSRKELDLLVQHVAECEELGSVEFGN